MADLAPPLAELAPLPAHAFAASSGTRLVSSRCNTFKLSGALLKLLQRAQHRKSCECTAYSCMRSMPAATALQLRTESSWHVLRMLVTDTSYSLACAVVSTHRCNAADSTLHPELYTVLVDIAPTLQGMPHKQRQSQLVLLPWTRHLYFCLLPPYPFVKPPCMLTKSCHHSGHP